MANAWVGVYVSTRYVDIAEVAGAPHSPRLLSFIREEISSAPPAKLDDSEIRERLSSQERVEIALKKGLARLKTKPPGVYTVLQTSDVMVRYFVMSQVPKAERTQAIRYEARKYIPFKLDDIVSDFKAFPSAKLKNKMEVFFIAATKERLNSHINLFKNAGTISLGVDIIPFALMRTLLLHKKIAAKDNAIILYIDNDTKTATVHIIESGMPFLSRDMDISTDDKEALFEKLVSEIRVSFDYYHRLNPQKIVSRIVVCGEKLFDGLGAYIANEIKLPAEVLDDMPAVKSKEGVYSSSIISVGIAIGGIRKLTHSVNLAPTVATSVQRKEFTNIIITESIVALFVIITTFILTNFHLSSVSAKYDRTKEMGRDLPEATAALGIDHLKRLKRDKMSELELLQSLLNNRVFAAKKLGAIIKAAPEGLWVDDIVYEERKGPVNFGGPVKWNHTLDISGRAFSLESELEMKYINDFFKALEKDTAFMHFIENIKMSSIKKNRIGDFWVTYFRIIAGAKKRGGRTGVRNNRI